MALDREARAESVGRLGIQAQPRALRIRACSPQRRDAEATSAVAQDEAASAELAGLLRCEVCYALARDVWEPARQAVHAAAAMPPDDRLLRLLRRSCQAQARLLCCAHCGNLVPAVYGSRVGAGCDSFALIRSWFVCLLFCFMLTDSGQVLTRTVCGN